MEKQKETNHSVLNHFPGDVLAEVFSNLSITDLASTALVCRNFYQFFHSQNNFKILKKLDKDCNMDRSFTDLSTDRENDQHFYNFITENDLRLLIEQLSEDPNKPFTEYEFSDVDFKKRVINPDVEIFPLKQLIKSSFLGDKQGIKTIFDNMRTASAKDYGILLVLRVACLANIDSTIDFLLILLKQSNKEKDYNFINSWVNYSFEYGNVATALYAIDNFNYSSEKAFLKGVNEQCNKILEKIVEVYGNHFINDLCNKVQDRALHIACRRNDVVLVKFLLAQGADPNLANSHEETPLSIAHQKKQKDIINLLLLYKANNHFLQKRQSSLDFLVSLAKKDNGLDVVTVCDYIQYGFNFDQQDESGYTVMHYLAQTQQILPMHLIINSGASIDPLNLQYETPLHCATRLQNFDTMVWLINQGANYYFKDENGRNIIDLVIGHADTLESFKDYFRSHHFPEDERINFFYQILMDACSIKFSLSK